MTRKPDGKLPAPPHDETGHTWHHSDRQLLAITRDGLSTIAPGYVTDMPAFGDQLTDQEILAILDFIKSSWPERQRAFQAARSASDPLAPQ
jgi:mono/diheme cytochrome c family protein